MKLADLQRDFRDWLVAPSDDVARRLGPMTGLSVYQNNYRAQLVASLEHSLPQLRRWIGDDAFLAASVRHIDRHPPHAWTLDAYADDFHTTLAEHFPNNPDLHELAWIEHALGAAFVAADAAPLAQAALATVDWDAAHLRLTPSLLLRTATTNAERIWSALWQGSEVPQGEMLAQPAGLMVWRRGHACLLRQVDAIDHAALMQLRADASFAALCDMLVARLGEAAGIAKAGDLLAQWLGSDIITGIDTK